MPTKHTSNPLPWKLPACLILFWSQGHSVSFYFHHKTLQASCISIGAAHPFPILLGTCTSLGHSWCSEPCLEPSSCEAQGDLPQLGTFTLEVTPTFPCHAFCASFNEHLPKGPILCQELLRGTEMQSISECVSWLRGTHLPEGPAQWWTDRFKAPGRFHSAPGELSRVSRCSSRDGGAAKGVQIEGTAYTRARDEWET